MKFLLRALLCWLVFLFPVQAATTLDGLYEAEVVVPEGQQVDLNSPLVTDALRQVLVKVTGLQTLDEYADVALALKMARQFVREYGFHSVVVPAPDDVRQALGVDTLTQRVMRVAFLRGAVLQLVKQSGLPLWSPSRPDVLMWLAFDDYAQQQWVTPEIAPSHAQQLRNLASTRGLPLHFPSGDFQDDFALSPQELLQRDFSRVGAASARYNPDVVIAGQAVQTSEGVWIGSWRFTLDGQWQDFEVLGASKDEFLALGIERLADALAAKYAVLGDRQHSDLSVRVFGLRSFAEYSAFNDYLNTLTAVEKADIEVIDGEFVLFRIDLKGSLEQLENAIMLHKKMLPVSEHSLTQTYDLQYRWVGDDNE